MVPAQVLEVEPVERGPERHGDALAVPVELGHPYAARLAVVNTQNRHPYSFGHRFFDRQACALDLLRYPTFRTALVEQPYQAVSYC